MMPASSSRVLIQTGSWDRLALHDRSLSLFASSPRPANFGLPSGPLIDLSAAILGGFHRRFLNPTQYPKGPLDERSRTQGILGESRNSEYRSAGRKRPDLRLSWTALNARD